MTHKDFSRSRRNFLKYGAIGTGLVMTPEIVRQAASFFSPLEAKAEAAEKKSPAIFKAPNKVATDSLDLKLEDSNSIGIYVKIKRGIGQIDGGRNDTYYDNLHGIFRGIYETAGGRFKLTRDDADLALQVIALAHAGFSAFKAAGFVGMGESYLNKAYLDYGRALSLRSQLNDRTKKQRKHVEHVYVQGDRSGILLITEETLKGKLAEVLSYLYKSKNGDTREAYRQHGILLYNNLLASTKDPEKQRTYQIGLERLEYQAKQPLSKDKIH